MATPTNTKNNTPLIIGGAIVVAGIILFLFIPRGGTPGVNNNAHAPKPAELPQGRGAAMVKNPGKAVVLASATVTRLSKISDRGGDFIEGWEAEVAYTWKDQPDGKMTFKAPYRLADGRGNYAIPAPGTAGAGNPAAAPPPIAVKATAKAPAATRPTPTFLLPASKGKVRLLLPSTDAMKLKKGDKLILSLQIELNKWTIPASNEIKLPPLP